MAVNKTAVFGIFLTRPVWRMLLSVEGWPLFKSRHFRAVSTQ